MSPSPQNVLRIGLLVHFSSIYTLPKCTNAETQIEKFLGEGLIEPLPNFFPSVL